MKSEQDALLFLDFISSRHPNIRFIVDKESKRVISFVDVITNNNNKQLLDFVEQNIVICQWRVDSLFAEAKG